MKIRIGQGVDVHAFKLGRKLVLGGVNIPSDFGLDGHSDADIVLHALVDAILGALGLSDIGTYFPDTDLVNKDRDSRIFLIKAYELMIEKKYSIINIDISILLEKPKVAPYINQMKKIISELLNINSEDCAIKATTCEKMGFIGRQEGAMAFAVILLKSDEV